MTASFNWQRNSSGSPGSAEYTSGWEIWYLVGGSAKVEGKEEKEEREGKGENFQQKSVKALFIHRNQVMFNKKSYIQISPAICLIKLNHMQVWNRLYFQVNHKQSSFPIDRSLSTCLLPSATQRYNPSSLVPASRLWGDECCWTRGLQRISRRQEEFKKQIQLYILAFGSTIQMNIYLSPSDFISCFFTKKKKKTKQLKRAVSEEKDGQKKPSLAKLINVSSFTQRIWCPLFFSLHPSQSLYICLLHCQLRSQWQ